MRNRDIYHRDPAQVALPNSGVAAMTDAQTEDERRTLRFELAHFVCEGEYQRGLVRILESYISHQGQPEQPAAWISGFFGSGKSHLAKMLRFLWTDYAFPDDGATARGLAQLPDDVREQLTELSTLGRRGDGLHAAAGTLGAGAGDSVRLALLGVMFKSKGLPEGYPQARFCLWLQKNGIFDEVKAAVEAAGKDFRRELNDLYVSPLIARALLAADAEFATTERAAKSLLREQFPRLKDITTDQFTDALHDALAPDGEGLPNTVVILDEVQQYIGEDAERSYVVQEVAEACSKRFGDRLLFLGTGQTALSATPRLQRLQGRFTVNVELSDNDVETVIRRVVLAKREDRIADVRSALDAHAGEIDRQLRGTRIAPRSEDAPVLADDYPLLPVRRRFWEQALRAVDSAGMAGQLRTQLRIVYEAIRETAGEPLGTVVPADFLFDQLAPNLLNTGALLREIHQTIVGLNDGSPDGILKSRLCALVFLIRKLPRDAGVDTGIRANSEMLADLLVKDLASDGTALRSRLPALLAELVDAGTLMKLDDEYSLQTKESSDWEAEFRTRRNRLANDPASMSAQRSERLREAVNRTLAPIKILHGEAKEPRKLDLYFGTELLPSGQGITVWIRDGWGSSESSALAEARAAGQDDATVHVFIPRAAADQLARLIATRSAATETVEYKGVPTTEEGIEARHGMETRATEAENNLRAVVARIVDGAKVIQGGGNERLEAGLADKVRAAAMASLARLYPEFPDADDNRWRTVIERARGGAENPLEVVGFAGKTEEHRVCAAVLQFVGSGRKGREVRTHFAAPPYGWPRDAVDAATICLFGTGHLRATANGATLRAGQLDQGKVAATDFRTETATVDTRQRLQLRALFQTTGIACKPNEEGPAAAELLSKLLELAQNAGGDAPLPARPTVNHIEELQSASGNEQLLAVLKRHDELASNFKDWEDLGKSAQQRLPAYERLLALAKHATELDAGKAAQPQIDAIKTNRSLLAPTDPVPALARTLADALRSALVQAVADYDRVFEDEQERLAASASWQQIEPVQRDAILAQLHITKATAGATGTEQEVLLCLQDASLDDWRIRTAALPQQFANARSEADKLLEPKTRHVKLSSDTLRTEDDVRAWARKTEQELVEQVKQGPVVVN